MSTLKTRMFLKNYTFCYLASRSVNKPQEVKTLLKAILENLSLNNNNSNQHVCRIFLFQATK